MSGAQKVRGPSLRKVRKSGTDGFVREVNETVSTQNSICVGKPIFCNIRHQKGSSCSCIVAKVVTYELGYDVDTYVVDCAQIGVSHPVKVAAGGVK